MSTLLRQHRLCWIGHIPHLKDSHILKGIPLQRASIWKASLTGTCKLETCARLQSWVLTWLSQLDVLFNTNHFTDCTKGLLRITSTTGTFIYETGGDPDSFGLICFLKHCKSSKVLATRHHFHEAQQPTITFRHLVLHLPRSTPSPGTLHRLALFHAAVFIHMHHKVTIFSLAHYIWLL